MENSKEQEAGQKRLVGRSAVVTGSSSGNGRAIALALAAEGASVLCSDVRRSVHPDSEDELADVTTDELIVQRGGEAKFLEADVTSEEDVDRLADLAVESFGGLDVWVNNAGVSDANPIEDETVEGFERQLKVNVIGTWLGCKAAVRAMRARERSGRSRGRIINLGSIAAEFGQGTVTAYASSKGAVHALTRELAIEVVNDYINVNAIAPGFFLGTAMNRVVRENPEFLARVYEQTPWPEMAPTSDLGRVVAFLASDDAAWITGAILPVDGGQLAS